MPSSHVLICRTDNLGDVVLTLPIAGYLKRLDPGIRIGFLCRSYAAPLVRLCAAIDYVIEVEKLDQATGLGEETGIDTILFAKPDRRLAKAAKRAGIRHRIGTARRWYHWLYCNRLVNFSRVKSSLHEAQLNFMLLRGMGIDHIPPLQEIPALFSLTLRDGHDERLRKQHFNLVIHPKSNGNGREWPVGHFVELARLLRQHPDLRIWVTGSEREGEWIREHAPDLLKMSNATSLCGQLTLDELNTFISAADGLIASGTGPLHISAALGQRTLGLFPLKKPIDAGRWGPLGERCEVLVSPKDCEGCKTPEECTCMEAIEPLQVANVVAGWFELKRKSA